MKAKISIQGIEYSEEQIKRVRKKKRAKGYYRVQSFIGEWYIAFYNSKYWLHFADENKYLDENFKNINETPVNPTPEQ